MKELILYGAGANSQATYEKLANECRTPVCLCDGDLEKIGQIKHFDGRAYDITHLDQALNRFPNAEIYVSPKAPVKYEIMDMLQKEKGIDKSRIVNYTPYIYGRKCIFVQQRIFFMGSGICFCCYDIYKTKMPSVPYSLSNEEVMDKLQTIRFNILDDWQNGRESEYCVGCPEAGNGYYEISDLSKTKWDINYVGFGIGHMCNLNCLYCAIAKLPKSQYKQEELQGSKTIKRALGFIRYLQENEAINETAWVRFSGGEIAIHPMRNELLQEFSEYACEFVTNAAVYSTDIENVLRKGKSRINVSLDAGTPETYKQIKGGGDLFETFDNIRQYSRYAYVTTLKYILIPGINDDNANIDGFLDFAKEVNARVVLSHDLCGIENWESNIDKAMKAVEYFRKSTSERGLDVSIRPGVLLAGKLKGKIIARQDSVDVPI